MKRYTIISDFIRKKFSQGKLTFSVEKMKSDDLVLVRPYVQIFDIGKTYIQTFWSQWWVVGNKYQPHSFSFTINDATLTRTAYIKVGMKIDNIDKNNRLYFNHIQLSEGTETNYHQPESTIPKTSIKFQNNFYANLYTSSKDSYLQIIRPYYNNIDTETITKSKVTVLAPHLMNEDDIDSPNSIGLEFMNQTDQVIEILR